MDDKNRKVTHYAPEETGYIAYKAIALLVVLIFSVVFWSVLCKAFFIGG